MIAFAGRSGNCANFGGDAATASLPGMRFFTQVGFKPLLEVLDFWQRV
jgi:hypothetical protein